MTGYLHSVERLLLPCGCSCSALWLSVFAAEMRRRLHKRKPRNVQKIFARALVGKRDEFRDQLLSVMARRDAAILAGELEWLDRHERDMVALYQQMADTLPEHELPQDLHLHEKAISAARARGDTLPSDNTRNHRLFTIGVEKLQLAVLAMATYRNAQAAVLRAVAHKVHKQLIRFVVEGTALGIDVIEILARICPACEAFLPRDAATDSLTASTELQPRRRFIEIPRQSERSDQPAVIRKRLRDVFPRADEDFTAT